MLKKKIWFCFCFRFFYYNRTDLTCDEAVAQRSLSLVQIYKAIANEFPYLPYFETLEYRLKVKMTLSRNPHFVQDTLRALEGGYWKRVCIGSEPLSLQVGHIFFFHKKDVRINPENYRPLSVFDFYIQRFWKGIAWSNKF